MTCIVIPSGQIGLVGYPLPRQQRHLVLQPNNLIVPRVSNKIQPFPNDYSPQYLLSGTIGWHHRPRHQFGDICCFSFQGWSLMPISCLTHPTILLKKSTDVLLKTDRSQQSARPFQTQQEQYPQERFCPSTLGWLVKKGLVTSSTKSPSNGFCLESWLCRDRPRTWS